MTFPRNQADPGPSGGYRDQILHANSTPDDEWDPAYVEALRTGTLQQYVQDVQAPGAYSVTSGHGECECGDCSTGWAYWWATRRG